MTLVTDKDVELALATLADETGAACRASHDYMEELTKSVLAELLEVEACAERASAGPSDDHGAHRLIVPDGVQRFGGAVLAAQEF